MAAHSPVANRSCRFPPLQPKAWESEVVDVIGEHVKAVRAWFASLPKADSDDTVEPIRWSKPDTPKRWAKVFGISEGSFKKYCANGSIKAKKLSDRAYRVAMVAKRVLATLPPPFLSLF